MADKVARVGRSPLRKLAATDRLVRPALQAAAFGMEAPHLVSLISAALLFDYELRLRRCRMTQASALYYTGLRLFFRLQRFFRRKGIGNSHGAFAREHSLTREGRTVFAPFNNREGRMALCSCTITSKRRKFANIRSGWSSAGRSSLGCWS
ncbi:hypothetical protein [Cohnella thermotolerans]|uniref:hypothetical protein n=1 Tax=Cohnella thermotolerans TaxID=329858 RepID=UPI003B8310CE